MKSIKCGLEVQDPESLELLPLATFHVQPTQQFIAELGSRFGKTAKLKYRELQHVYTSTNRWSAFTDVDVMAILCVMDTYITMGVYVVFSYTITQSDTGIPGFDRIMDLETRVGTLERRINSLTL